MPLSRHKDFSAEMDTQNTDRDACGIVGIADLHGRASNGIVRDALLGISNLEHRGAAEDGAGVNVSIDREFAERYILASGKHLPAEDEIAVATIHIAPEVERHRIRDTQQLIETSLGHKRLRALGFREVPMVRHHLKPEIDQIHPSVWQLLIGQGRRREMDFDSAIYKAALDASAQLKGVYFAGKLVPNYKTLARSDDLVKIFPDLAEYKAVAAAGHRRFATNTLSFVQNAQPFGTILHNGEINAIRSKRLALENIGRSMLHRDNLQLRGGSDSAHTNDMVEFLMAHGFSLPETLRMMFPEATGHISKNPDNQKLLEYYADVRHVLDLLGNWEGPAGIIGLDTDHLVTILDRSGFRPLRYLETKDGKFMIASEIGVIPAAADNILYTGQLRAGEMIAVNLKNGEVLKPAAMNKLIVEYSPFNRHRSQRPRNIGRRQKETLFPSSEISEVSERVPKEKVLRCMNELGWDKVRLDRLVAMIEAGTEPVGSMGFHKQLAIFRDDHPNVYAYLKQKFAEVTNPPVDYLREKKVMDLAVNIGARPKFHKTPYFEATPHFRSESPILTNEQMRFLRDADSANSPRVNTVDLSFTPTDVRSFMNDIERVITQTVKMVRRGETDVIVLSDHPTNRSGSHCLPALLILGAIQRELIDDGLMRKVSIVVQGGDVTEPHAIAALLAHGATAVNPYNAFDFAATHENLEKAKTNLHKALNGGLMKIMSKMGITTFEGYCLSQLFECIGLSKEISDGYLMGTTSKLGGIGMQELFEDILARSTRKGTDKIFKSKEHDVWKDYLELFKRVREIPMPGTDPQEYAVALEEAYEAWVAATMNGGMFTVRDILEFTDGAGIPLDCVESEKKILADTIGIAGMSFGALNESTYKILNDAARELGMHRSSGEGGEPYEAVEEGWSADIHQLGTARFSCHRRFMRFAKELEIKVGQGAKPGEGGQLPGYKVNERVAQVRGVQVGQELISPPPHHDFYSIEDLAQLIYCLKQFNPDAKISVKIPAGSDSDMVALGIVKAGADIVTLSGFDGGTGASIAASIEHAGIPIERAVAAAHQRLMREGLRESVTLRADGGVRTHYDVAKLGALGADATFIGTAALMGGGCIQARVCHTGNCPSGQATWNENLIVDMLGRKNIPPEYLDAFREMVATDRLKISQEGTVQYFRMLAKSLRGLFARLGVRNMKELRGRIDTLQKKKMEHTEGAGRGHLLDPAELLQNVSKYAVKNGQISSAHAIHRTVQTAVSEKNQEIVRQAQEVLNGAMDAVHISLEVNNTDRGLGATISGILEEKLGKKSAGKRVVLNLKGEAGYGLGFQAGDGIEIRLEGFANDSVGVHMDGNAKIVVFQPREIDGDRSANSVIGNQACYGATSGQLFVEGSAGERLGVRNSGATIVTEGAGDYAFEYMTGGTGLVLGPIGSSACSGMTGGKVFFLNEQENLEEHIIPDSVDVDSVNSEENQQIFELINRHFQETKSPKAAHILKHWDEFNGLFMVARAKAIRACNGK